MSGRRAGVAALLLVATLLPACGGRSWHRAACAPARPAHHGIVPLTLPSGGTTRRALLYVPRSYDGTVELPLVFTWHGYGANATEQLQGSDLLPLADDKRFLVVAPEGEGSPTRFNMGTGITGATDDVQLASDLIDRIGHDLCVDRRRVYSVGVSNGAGMSALLACRSPDRFAAVGMIALLLKPTPCASSAPPVLAMMGDADPVIPFRGGHVACCGGWSIPPAGRTMDAWAAHLRCTGQHDDTVAEHVDRRTWTGCSDGRRVVYYVVHGGGHTWPGDGGDGPLGATNHEISASKIMWDFFARYTTAAN